MVPGASRSFSWVHQALGTHDEGDFPGDGVGGEHPIDAIRLDGRLGHAGVFGRCRILGKHQATAGLDCPDPARAVRAGARQDHANHFLATLGGDGIKNY
jgi:hypothetical protein